MNKQAQLNIALLATAAIAFVIFGISTSVGAQIIDKVEDKLDQPYNDTALNLSDSNSGRTVAYNTTQHANEGLEELSSWADIIAIVIAASIVLGIITLFAAR